MEKLFVSIALALALVGGPLAAGPLGGAEAEIYVLGEVHDNPAHHAVQAEAVAEVAPRALVFEMLTPGQAAGASGVARDDAEALGAALDWAANGWPDFAMYYPIFAAAPEAALYGAGVPRDETRTAMKIGVPRSFGAGAELYGLTEELDAEALADQLNLQMDAHCGALPLGLLPGMVELQRLRDAVLARAALAALEETGGPVVVITGNGHARPDWGVPSYIARVAPEVAVFTLGQGEDGGAPEGGFDLVLDAPSVERPDPCAEFQ
ncbi:MAG: ChaN family lipoprotein [Maritimibacter sp.]|nr:ChaN family lipoprotein [Maritimibacter sp.]